MFYKKSKNMKCFKNFKKAISDLNSSRKVLKKKSSTSHA